MNLSSESGELDEKFHRELNVSKTKVLGEETASTSPEKLDPN